jgi:subtilase family serine protease
MMQHLLNRRTAMLSAQGSRRAAILVALVLVLAVMLTADGVHALLQSHQSMPTTHQATLLGAVPSTKPLDIALVLNGRDPAALAQLLTDISTPGSASYRHFLSPEAYAQRFAPTTDERALVGQVLQQAHFTLLPSDEAGILLWARGTVAQVEALFHVQMNDYHVPNGTHYEAANTVPTIPTALRSAVSGVLGLDSRQHLQSPPVRSLALPAATLGGALAPADLVRAYDLGPLQSQGLDGTNQTIALAEIDSFRASDIQAYDDAFGIKAPAITTVPVLGGADGSSIEAPMDIEVLHAIAPHAHLIVYEGPADLASLAQMFQQVVAEHRAQILSVSLGICEIDGGGPDSRSFLNAINQTFQKAGAEGMSVLIASGDSGAYGCQNDNLSVSLPASNPNVTAVGGTTLFMNDDGTYAREASWEGPLESVGTGGGLSRIYKRPSWQTGAGVDNAASNGMRQVPDVAADADPLSGYLIYDSKGTNIFGKPRCDSGGCWQVAAGTSASTPLWAGLIALANQAAAKQGKSTLGFLNPALYALAAASRSPSPFHDVTIGGNLYYNATAGWDYCTGLGTPDAAVLIPDLVSQ